VRALNEAAQAEFDALVERHGGSVLPSHVVEFARDETTALHSYFDWNDSEAARQWRLEQARRVIRLSVTVVRDDPRPIRAMVSLTTDRRDGIGYRSLQSVLSDNALRAQMEMDALNELRAFRRKYERLASLSPLWPVIEQIESARIVTGEHLPV
jgi:hypothetical protein